MSKSTKSQTKNPEVVSSTDPEVLQFRAQFDQRAPLDELVREGAQRMLQSAIEAEVNEFLMQFSSETPILFATIANSSAPGPS